MGAAAVWADMLARFVRRSAPGEGQQAACAVGMGCVLLLVVKLYAHVRRGRVMFGRADRVMSARVQGVVSSATCHGGIIRHVTPCASVEGQANVSRTMPRPRAWR